MASLPPQPQVFAHLGAPNAALYRAIMAVFARAKERFIVHLRPEDVAAELRRDDDEQLGQALDQLTEWGNLRADVDTGRVSSVEDFHRKRLLFQLTPAGQAAEQSIAFYEEAIGRRGQLQAVALGDIADQLSALVVLARREDPDPAAVHLILIALAERFGSLADNAQAFMSSLRRAIDFSDGDVDGFVAYKERLIDYIDRFIAELANSGARIARLLLELEELGHGRLLETAARREAADAVPDGGPSDDHGGDERAGRGGEAGGEFREAPAGRDGEADGEHRKVPVGRDGEAGGEYRKALAGWENRWRGLRDWFVSRDAGHPSQARLLRQSAVTAIKQLIDTVGLLNERRAGRSDRSADFRTLARWFADAPDEAAMHRLWRAAFGLTPARHLTGTSAADGAGTSTGASVDGRADAQTDGSAGAPADVPATTPWAKAPPVRISPQLRRTGSYERRGRLNKVADRSTARRLLMEQVEREAAQTAAARERLRTGGPVPLSRLDVLDPTAFRLFLGLLGDAMAARRPEDTEVKTTTGDGSMEVRLTLVPDGGTVEIETEDGVLTGPEHVIEITVLA
ncbi:TIGR02677 family protein [Nonomuraea longicatena]|uniref:TIGR02677 family protein n=1 Tax=Nonomuraea longicatena TaxID=83682 RepID=A0ABP3ZII3_9ACTN